MGLSRCTTMLVWKTLLTHRPSPIAGTSTTFSRGIRWAKAVGVSNVAKRSAVNTKHGQRFGFIDELVPFEYIALQGAKQLRAAPSRAESGISPTAGPISFLLPGQSEYSYSLPLRLRRSNSAPCETASMKMLSDKIPLFEVTR
jgi:hypothetical protein